MLWHQQAIASLAAERVKKAEPWNSERSRWEFEETYVKGKGGADIMGLFDKQWDEGPFLRVGIELRRILRASSCTICYRATGHTRFPRQ